MITDPLTGPAPTWQGDPGTPLFNAVVAELGLPGLLNGPGTVVIGELEEARTP